LARFAINKAAGAGRGEVVRERHTGRHGSERERPPALQCRRFTGSAARSSKEQKEHGQAVARDAAAPGPALKCDHATAHVQHPHPHTQRLPDLTRIGALRLQPALNRSV